ncbi:hypothetical protein [Nitriliruptor alkaliphilus]|uniref:hypothetical protein n=1 Tax=Nitriliruptor alkaliphilus TaxID=427918 RepID=UPI0012ED07BB|nr:hypothetical protein [Nitriliruptor alkaliphilus]
MSRRRVGEDPPDTRLAEALIVERDTGEVGLDPVLGPRLLYGDASPDVSRSGVVRAPRWLRQ